MKPEEAKSLLGMTEKRALFQDRCVLLNIVAMGTIASVVLANPEHVAVLLAIPAISFILFCFWLHNAMVLYDVGNYLVRVGYFDYRQGENIGVLQQAILRVTYLVAQLSHFVLAGVGVLVYLRSINFESSGAFGREFPTAASALWWVDACLCILALAGFILWYISFYHSSPFVKGN